MPAELGLPPSFTVHDLLDGRALPVADRAQLRAARAGRAPGARGPGGAADADRTAHAHAPDRRRAQRAASRRRAPSRRRRPGPDPPVVRGRAAVVQARRLLRDPRARLLRRQRRRLGRLPRADREARLPRSGSGSTASGCCRSTSRRCATAATTSPTSPRSTPTTAPSTTSSELIDAAHARRIRVIADLVMNHTSSEHPWFQESRSSPDSPEARLVRVVGHRRPLPGRADHLHRHRDLELDLGPGRRRRTTGTASSPTSPTSTTTTPRSRRRCSTCCASGSTSGSTASGSTRCPYLFEREGTNCENLPETHAYLQAGPRARSTSTTPTGCCSPRPTSGPPTSSQYFGDGDECQMAFHFPVMPRMFMALRREEAVADLRDPRADADDPRQLPVGPVPAQPRRADARDGHRRGARLHVLRVRQGPADEAQPRDPPAARAAARQRPRRDRAAARDHVLAARLAGPLLRRRDRDGRQRLPRRPRRRPHADAVDRATATAASPGPTSRSCTRRR